MTERIPARATISASIADSSNLACLPPIPDTTSDGQSATGSSSTPLSRPIDAARDEAQQVAGGLRLGQRGFTQRQAEITVDAGDQFDRDEYRTDPR